MKGNRSANQITLHFVAAEQAQEFACSCVSTPSAMTRSSSECASEMMVSTSVVVGNRGALMAAANPVRPVLLRERFSFQVKGVH
jgi:hypothetical protein